MPTSQNSTPDVMMSKLLEVDAQLASQEAKVEAQLASVREKRQSLQTVIDIFAAGDEASASTLSAMSLFKDEPSVPTNGATTPAPAKPSPLEEEEPVAVTEPDETEFAESDEEEESPPPTKTTRKPRGRGGRAARAAKSTRSPKAASSKGRGKGGGASWQNYVRKEYENTTLPQAVLAVLEKEPNDVVEVPSILDAIFVDDIPKQARTSARDRLSNILSVGLKNNKWYRGKTGHYSVSKEAALASLV
ncbi:MAG: hypothetical protein ACFB8W_04895 [Elainellaceae cyanobacterium]